MALNLNRYSYKVKPKDFLSRHFNLEVVANFKIKIELERFIHKVKPRGWLEFDRFTYKIKPLKKLSRKFIEMLYL